MKRYQIPHNLPPAVHSLIKHHAAAHRTTLDALLAGERHPRGIGASAARYSAIVRLISNGYSYSQIGRWLRLHHTTVMYHAKRAMSERAVNAPAIAKGDGESRRRNGSFTDGISKV